MITYHLHRAYHVPDATQSTSQTFIFPILEIKTIAATYQLR